MGLEILRRVRLLRKCLQLAQNRHAELLRSISTKRRRHLRMEILRGVPLRMTLISSSADAWAMRFPASVVGTFSGVFLVQRKNILAVNQMPARLQIRGFAAKELQRRSDARRDIEIGRGVFERIRDHAGVWFDTNCCAFAN